MELKFKIRDKVVMTEEGKKEYVDRMSKEFGIKKAPVTVGFVLSARSDGCVLVKYKGHSGPIASEQCHLDFACTRKE
jgi:hypothetical protein